MNRKFLVIFVFLILVVSSVVFAKIGTFENVETTGVMEGNKTILRGRVTLENGEIARIIISAKLLLGGDEFNIAKGKVKIGDLEHGFFKIDVERELDPDLFSFSSDIKIDKDIDIDSGERDNIEDTESFNRAWTDESEYQAKIGFHYSFNCPKEERAITNYQEQEGLDIMFVVDRSKTIEETISNMKDSMIGIVGILDSSKDRVALTSFGTYGTVVSGYTNDFSQFNEHINNWKAYDTRTNIADGIKKAMSVINNAPSDRKKIMILISDGIVNTYTSGQCTSFPIERNICTHDTLRLAWHAKNTGTEIYTIGYYYKISDLETWNVGSFARSLMTYTASPGKHIEASANLSNLYNIFGAIVKKEDTSKKQSGEVCSNLVIKFNKADGIPVLESGNPSYIFKLRSKDTVLNEHIFSLDLNFSGEGGSSVNDYYKITDTGNPKLELGSISYMYETSDGEKKGGTVIWNDIVKNSPNEKNIKEGFNVFTAVNFKD